MPAGIAPIIGLLRCGLPLSEAAPQARHASTASHCSRWPRATRSHVPRRAAYGGCLHLHYRSIDHLAHAAAGTPRPPSLHAPRQTMQQVCCLCCCRSIASATCKRLSTAAGSSPASVSPPPRTMMACRSVGQVRFSPSACCTTPREETMLLPRAAHCAAPCAAAAWMSRLLQRKPAARKGQCCGRAAAFSVRGRGDAVRGGRASTRAPAPAAPAAAVSPPLTAAFAPSRAHALRIRTGRRVCPREAAK